MCVAFKFSQARGLSVELTPPRLVLLLLAVSTVFLRYRGHKGRLIHIIRRDGGLYYVTLAGEWLSTGLCLIG